MLSSAKLWNLLESKEKLDVDVNIYIYIYIYISIWKSFNDVLYKAKIVLKTHIFCMYLYIYIFGPRYNWSENRALKQVLKMLCPISFIVQWSNIEKSFQGYTSTYRVWSVFISRYLKDTQRINHNICFSVTIFV